MWNKIKKAAEDFGKWWDSWSLADIFACLEDYAKQVILTFEDGTEISYDRKNKVLTINAAGDIEVHTKGNITIKADGDMTLTAKGNMKLQASQIDLN